MPFLSNCIEFAVYVENLPAVEQNRALVHPWPLLRAYESRLLFQQVPCRCCSCLAHTAAVLLRCAGHTLTGAE